MDATPLFVFLVEVFRAPFFATAGLVAAAWLTLIIISLIVDVLSPREIQSSSLN